MEKGKFVKIVFKIKKRKEILNSEERCKGKREKEKERDRQREIDRER